MNDFSNVIQIQWQFYSDFIQVVVKAIPMKFCAWQDKCAIVAYAKFLVKLKPIFHQIWITTENHS